MPDKIIFLDIDGPMIPSTQYLFDTHASYDQSFNDTCVRVLKLILEKSEAKLVINSTHNNMWEKETDRQGKEIWPGLLNVLIQHELDPFLHDDPRTVYPGIDRLSAIKMWLDKNKTEHMLWVALDDAKIEHKRAFEVDFTHGIGLDAYNHCAHYLIYRPFNVLM